jgi:hypothetical protein
MQIALKSSSNFTKNTLRCINFEKQSLYTECPKKIVTFYNFFFLGAHCVESGVSCTDCY